MGVSLTRTKQDVKKKYSRKISLDRNVSISLYSPSLKYVLRKERKNDCTSIPADRLFLFLEREASVRGLNCFFSILKAVGSKKPAAFLFFRTDDSRSGGRKGRDIMAIPGNIETARDSSPAYFCLYFWRGPPGDLARRWIKRSRVKTSPAAFFLPDFHSRRNVREAVTASACPYPGRIKRYRSSLHKRGGATCWEKTSDWKESSTARREGP